MAIFFSGGSSGEANVHPKFLGENGRTMTI